MKTENFIIYKVTCLINKKIYIGQTTKTLEKRKKEHENSAIKENGFAFQRALKKYGFHNFKWEIIGCCNSKNELDEAEIACIEFFQCTNKLYGYNIHVGGTGGNTIPKEDLPKFIEKIKQALSSRSEEEIILQVQRWKQSYVENNSKDKQITSFKKTLKDNPMIKKEAEETRQQTIRSKYDYDTFYKDIHKKRLETERLNPEIQIRRTANIKKTLENNPDINKNRAEKYKIDSEIRNIIKKQCFDLIDFFDISIDFLKIIQPSNMKGGLNWLKFYCDLEYYIQHVLKECSWGNKCG